MIKQAIQKVIDSENLTQEEMEQVFSQIMSGKATDAQIAAFIVALRLKGESVDEITAAAKIMRGFAEPIKVDSAVILDTCGTGGSGLHTFNVSTLVALIASCLDITVAKHGNRSASGKSGSADLLEKMGVNINAEPKTVEKSLNDLRFGFLFAPKFHKAMKYAIGPRKEIGIRTIFNILGPLTNPAAATHQLLGVSAAGLQQPMINVLANLGLKHALVVHADDGMDEISTCSETRVFELKQGKISDYKIAPEDFGFKRPLLAELQVNDADDSLRMTRDVLSAKKGPVYDLTVLNAAFAVYVADAAQDINSAKEKVINILATDKVRQKLELVKKYSHEIYT